MTKEEIGLILKELRVSCSMTQKEVAEKIGRTQQIVGHWETGYAQPDANTLFTLCNIYGVTVDDAFGFQKKDSISKEDYERIRKYKFISEYSSNGAAVVDMVMDREYEIAEKLKEQEEQLIRHLPHQLKAGDILEYRNIDYFYDASAGGGIFILGNEPDAKIAIPASELDDRADYIIRVNGNSMSPDYLDGDNVMVSQRVEMKHGDVGIFVVNGKAYIKEYGKKELISRNPESPNIAIHEYDNIVCLGKVIGKLKGEYQIING